jgi:two-component system response regulator HydG
MNPEKTGFNILVVDDEEDLSWVLHLFLTTQGHRASISKNAYEAEALARSQSFHLALVDAKLPDLDGIELVKRIRVSQPNLTCFLVSGFYGDGDAKTKAWLDCGIIAGFISKPFHFDQILKAINSLPQVPSAC